MVDKIVNSPESSKMTTENKPVQTLGQRLRSTRTGRGQTQEQAARAMGVTLSAVCKWEQGVRQPTGLYESTVQEYMGGDNKKARKISKKT